MGFGSFQVVGFGQCCWDQFEQVEAFPAVDEKVESSGRLEQGGGPVATALVSLARLGVACAFLGTIGGDREGVLIREGLQREKIGCEYLQLDPEGTSQRATIIVEAGSGLRTIFWQRGVRRPFVVSDQVRQLVAASGILLLDGLEAGIAVDFAGLARQSGVVTVLDGGSLRDGSRDLLPLIDHLVVSQKFARQFCGNEDPREALAPLLDTGAKAVTVTCGAEGAWGLSAGEIFHQPAFVVDVLDTTGCGDVFHGGYVYGLLQGWSHRRVVRFASACAACNSRCLGGQGGLPSLVEVLALENSGAC